MQMHDVNCVPGSVTHLRTFVSSSILALHPCLFNLFFSHLFSSWSSIWKYAHYNTSNSLLPLTLQMPHSYRSTSPLLLSPSPLKSNWFFLWGITTHVLFPPSILVANNAISISTPISMQEWNRSSFCYFHF